MFTVRVTRHLNSMGLCFGVHLQVVFIAWLLASWAIVSFVSNIVLVPRVFREFGDGLYGCHGTISLDVSGGGRPLTVPNRMQTHIGNICEPTRVGTVVM